MATWYPESPDGLPGTGDVTDPGARQSPRPYRPEGSGTPLPTRRSAQAAAQAAEAAQSAQSAPIGQAPGTAMSGEPTGYETRAPRSSGGWDPAPALAAQDTQFLLPEAPNPAEPHAPGAMGAAGPTTPAPYPVGPVTGGSPYDPASPAGTSGPGVPLSGSGPVAAAGGPPRVSGAAGGRRSAGTPQDDAYRPAAAPVEAYLPAAERPSSATPYQPDEYAEQPYREPSQGAAGYLREQLDASSRPDPGYADPGYADPGYADPGYAGAGYADHYPTPGTPAPPLGTVAPGPVPPGPAGSAPQAPAPAPQPGPQQGRAAGQSLSRILAALAWPVMAIGLFIPEDGSSAFGRIPAWAGFALVCLVLVGVGAFGGPQGPGQGRTSTLGMIGAGGLVAFWLLLVLPHIGRNTSFALTLGTALAVAGVWLTSGRRRL